MSSQECGGPDAAANTSLELRIESFQLLESELADIIARQSMARPPPVASMPPLPASLERALSADDLFSVSQLQGPSQTAHLDGVRLSGMSGALPRLDCAALDNCPGHFGFAVVLQSEDRQPGMKAATWTFSDQLQRLYVNRLTPLPVVLHTASAVPRGAVVRTYLRYTSAAFRAEPVRRCPVHVRNLHDEPSGPVADASRRRAPRSHSGRADGAHDGASPRARRPSAADAYAAPPPTHVVQALHPDASYEMDPRSGAYSVLVPLRGGADSVSTVQTVEYRMLCYSSCACGIGRRDVQLVFTLELHGDMVGAQAVDTRICACPGRDRMTAEKMLRPVRPSAEQPRRGAATHPRPPTTTDRPVGTATTDAVTQVRHVSDDNRVFTVQVIGRENYELVRRIVDGLHRLWSDQADGGATLLPPPSPAPPPAAAAAAAAPSPRPKRPRHRQAEADDRDSGSAGKHRQHDADGDQDSENVSQRTEPADPNTDVDAAAPSGSWLSKIGLASYETVMQQHGFSHPAALAGLADKDLDAMGITDAAHRQRLLCAARAMFGTRQEARRTVRVVRCTMRRTLSAAVAPSSQSAML